MSRVFGISSAPKFLTELPLGSNSFDRKFPSNILKLYRLKKLYLLRNSGISGNVPSNIGKMTSLIELELYLSFTSLYGNIPSDCGLLKYLHSLLSYGIDLVPTYISFLYIICIDTTHRYQLKYYYDVR